MDRKIVITCQIHLSTKCSGSHQICRSNFYRNKKRNGGIFKCKPCARYEQAFNKNGYFLTKNTSYFEKIKTELQAYMLGIIAGDGSLYRDHFRVVAADTDIETLKIFQSEISPNSKIKKYKDSKCYYIDIASVKLANDICKILNIKPGKKTNVISLPNLNKKLIWHFIRGLIDSDGSILDIRTSKRTFPVCSYASRSELIKKQIKKLCDKENINYTCDKVSIIFNGINAINFMNKIYHSSTVFLSRKYKLYQLAITWLPQQGSLFRPRKIRKDKGIERKDGKTSS